MIDLREATSQSWNLPDTHVVWPQILALADRYKIQLNLLEDVFWITSELKEFISKLRMCLENQENSPGHWTACLNEIVKSFNDMPCDGRTLLYRVMRGELVSELYVTIANVAASQHGGNEEDDFFGEGIGESYE